MSSTMLRDSVAAGGVVEADNMQCMGGKMTLCAITVSFARTQRITIRNTACLILFWVTIVVIHSYLVANISNLALVDREYGNELLVFGW
jgi:hypothetical protein